MKYAKAFDSLPSIVKILLTIFFDFITGGLYRLMKGLDKKDVLKSWQELSGSSPAAASSVGLSISSASSLRVNTPSLHKKGELKC